MNNKMNGLYITALILFLVSVVIMISNITVSVILQDRMISTILGISGVLIAMLGIIFATASKPKKIKVVNSDENVAENNEKISEEKTE
ncbi:MAG: hypothetical protein U0L20_05810 [Ruminococcus sp.]|nr:hypothetical protein [Ruminococcus sp.]